MSQMNLPSTIEIEKLPLDGGPEFNRLIHASSPYLLQHARNPVDWYPWCEEAFERAREENKLIFLSVGYSTCHWCHVMQRESFENPDVAALLNEMYISIKVDREERPDIDSVYMRATQLVTQRGGWPNSLWLMPDGTPLFAGTYFPVEDRVVADPTQGTVTRAGFKTMLQRLHSFFSTRRDEADAQAARFREALEKSALPDTSYGHADITRNLGDALTHQLSASFDSAHGGFTTVGPKFPPHASLRWLLYEVDRKDRLYKAQTVEEGTDEEAGEDTSEPPVELPPELEPPSLSALDSPEANMAFTTLREMALGGIHDQIGGGFHRYSTDGRWFLPHFEKMLYDNAQLAGFYADAFRLTGEPLFGRVARGIAEWAIRDIRGSLGGFFSAIDADSEGEEGTFYVWTHAEIHQALGASLGARFCDLYGIEEDGNWVDEATGESMPTNLPYLRMSLEAYAEAEGLDPDELHHEMNDALRTLYEVRKGREWPAVDDKILTGWNGLMVGALARVGAALNHEPFIQAAVRAADFLGSKLIEGGKVYGFWRHYRGRTLAFLDDCVFLASGMLDLYEATGIKRWLEASERLVQGFVEQFKCDVGGYLFCSPEHEQLLVSERKAVDGSVPSGNGMAALVFARLWRLTGKRYYSKLLDDLVETFSGQMVLNPRAMQTLTLAAMMRLDGVAEAEPAEEIERFVGADLRFMDDPVKVGVYLSTRRVRPGKYALVGLKVVVPRGSYIQPSDHPTHPTLVSLEDSPGIGVSHVAYPDLDMVDGGDEETGPVHGYHGSIWIFIALEGLLEQPEKNYRLNLEFKAQRCDEEGCHLPEERAIAISLALDLRAPIQVQRHEEIFRNVPAAIKRLLATDS